MTVIQVAPGSGDDTKAIQDAIDEAAAQGGGAVVLAPGTYEIDGTRNTVDAIVAYGVRLAPRVALRGAGEDTVLRFADGLTAGGRDPQMLFHGPNGVLCHVTIEQLTFDGNAEGNRLSGPLQLGVPECGTGWDGGTGAMVGDRRNCCAIHIGSATDTGGVQVTDFVVQDCEFRNFPGGNVILLHDRRTAQSAQPFSRTVRVLRNRFVDNGKDAAICDHSTVNVFADDVQVNQNCFVLPASASRVRRQVLTACELHGSSSTFNRNTTDHYGIGVIFAENLHHKATGLEAVGNTLKNHGYRGFDVSCEVNDDRTRPQLHQDLGALLVRGNTVAFSDVVAPANQRIMEDLGDDPRWLPFPKWGVSFDAVVSHQGVVKRIDSLKVIGNTFIGGVATQAVDACHPAGPIAGVGGLWGRGDATGRVGRLIVVGNTFRGMTCGLWLETAMTTVPRSVEVQQNAFEAFAAPPGMPSAYPSACGVYVVATLAPGAPSPIRELNVLHNAFDNTDHEPSYQFGVRVEGRADTKIYLLDNAFTAMATADVRINPPVVDLKGFVGGLRHIGGRITESIFRRRIAWWRR